MISLRDAKARLSELADRAAAGEDLVISKRGRAVARLTAARHARKPIDLRRLRALTRGMPRQAEGAARTLRRMRDQARY